MEQDALEKAKERLKSNYSKARSARHGAQLCQPTALGSVRRPGARPAPPRQTEAPTFSPALKAQGWAVKQSRSTGGYYYVHTANGREWSQWEPPVGRSDGAARAGDGARAAAALLGADDLLERSGRIEWVEDLADEFDLFDEEGKRPPGYSLRKAR